MNAKSVAKDILNIGREANQLVRYKRKITKFNFLLALCEIPLKCAFSI